MAKTIALLTDFGVNDVYVGVMKGVMRDICPDADFVDITHAIPAQAVRSGAFALRDSYRYFPQGTVFLVVVDPGVGSKRHPVAVWANSYGFIAPDNGVLSYALADADDYKAAILDKPEYQLPSPRSTFHGRDVFAPAAAHLANGVDIYEFGRRVDDLITLSLPRLEVTETKIVGEVIRIDHFGNIITSIGPLLWQDKHELVLKSVAEQYETVKLQAEKARVEVANVKLMGIRHAYYEVPINELLVQIDSMGQLEIAVNQGNAAARLQVQVGDIVTIYLPED